MTTNFRFQKNRVHLTYKYHLDPQDVFASFNGIGNGLVYWSIAHEQGKNGPGGGEPNERTLEELPYDHTHILLCWNKRLTFTQPRCFDVWARPPADGEAGFTACTRIVSINGRGATAAHDGFVRGPGDEVVHPHIQPLRDDKHAATIYYEYHHKEGVPFQGGTPPAQQNGQTLLIERIREADSLGEACAIAGRLPLLLSQTIMMGTTQVLKSEASPTSSSSEMINQADLHSYTTGKWNEP